MDFVEKFRDRVGMLKNLLLEANFKACANLSTDLLRTSEFAGYSEGIFIGEFFESLFTNVRQLESQYEVDKKDISKIQEATLPSVEFIQTNIPLNNEKNKAVFYDLILNVRCIVTETQILYFREKPFKKLPSSMPFPPSISDEEMIN